MDLLSMLMNATVKDVDGIEVGDVGGVHIVGGKLWITIDLELGDEGDPDDGTKEDIPEDDASKQEFPNIVVMGKAPKKEGTNHG